jgi:hypothetical protein
MMPEPGGSVALPEPPAAGLSTRVVRPVVAHAAVAVLFALLAVVLTWPLAAHLGTHVPGAGPDDNIVFLWTVWWVRQVLASPAAELFHTPYLFHPGGVDLVLHTHTALNAMLASTVFAGLSLPVAFNLTTLVSGTMNGFATYLLAWRTVSQRAAAVAAGVFVAASPAFAKQLHGHFNLYCAWVLILFVAVVLDAVRRRSALRAAAAGVLLAGVAYADYYYFVYACAFVACLVVYQALQPQLTVSIPPRSGTMQDGLLLGAAAAGLLFALLIWATGGFVVDLAGARLSMRSGRNVRAIAAALFLWWTWRRLRPRLRLHPVDDRGAGGAGLAAIVLAVAAVLLVPVAAAALELWRDGGYVSQAYVWRNAPAGADLATLVLGNPFNGLIGSQVMRVYDTLGIHAFSGPLWFGIVPLVLIGTWRQWRRHPAAPLWLFVSGVFLVWTLGPYLLIFGIDSGLPLPQVLLRYMPLAANARIPSHAVVFVVLGVGMLLAMALASWRERRGVLLTVGVMAVVLVDFWSAPIALHRLEIPSLYARLSGLPDGALLELPVGIRDGFGEEGRFDTSVLYYQTLHGRPIAGGYISRLSPRVADWYRTSPFGTFLKLSAGGEVDAMEDARPDEAQDFLVSTGIGYVVVNESLSGPGLRRYVEAMELTLVASDGTRHLYRIE